MTQASPTRLILCVLLPFAAGYYLSFLFRSINALIAADLTAELGLSAADLGLLTSAYFLLFAAVQLPCGVLLDRYGPRLVNSTLFLVAAAGSLLFAIADSVWALMLGRALIGLGVATGLVAGLKAIVLWFPPERVALANGCYIMLGALGALSATGPAEMVVHSIGWRGLFSVLAASTAAVAFLILLVVPEKKQAPASGSSPKISFSTIYRDLRFWRIAPLASLGVGTSFSLQGLWAAPWLTDVAGLDRSAVVEHLILMAAVLSASALLLGALAERLRRAGIPTEVFLAATLGLSMAAQLALLLGLPVSSRLLFATIAAAGAGAVLSFAILARYFPKEVAGRANAALGVLNMGAAFGLQSLAGVIIAQWPAEGGHYPAVAYQAALAAGLGLQLSPSVCSSRSGVARSPLPWHTPSPGPLRSVERHRWPRGQSTRHGRTKPRLLAGREALGRSPPSHQSPCAWVSQPLCRSQSPARQSRCISLSCRSQAPSRIDRAHIR